MATLLSRVRAPKDILFRDLDGEAVILNVRTGEYYGLNDTGTRMWLLLAQQPQLALVLPDLVAEYEATEEQLERDLLGFVNRLLGRGLLELDES